MTVNYKPAGYNSASPYFIVKDAPKFMELMRSIFDAKELRVYNMPDGSIIHAEMMIQDSVIMIGESSVKFPAVPMVMHVYVANADLTYKNAIDRGCISIEPPTKREGDPDRRATFTDFAGNMWSVGTQIHE